MSRLRSCLVTLLLTVPFAASIAGGQAISGPSFREFSGVCQGNPNSPFFKNAIGWDRWDLSWGTLEPKQGEWRQARLDEFGKRVLQYREQNAKVVVTLTYNAPWSYEVAAREYAYGKKRITVQPQKDGRLLRSILQRDEHDN